MKFCLLTCHNLYESKRHFTAKFAEALNRKGIETNILTWPHGPVPEPIVDEMRAWNPDLTCSFHQLPPQQDGRYFWDIWKHPHWTILVDPAFYDLELMQSPWSIISCVDRTDCELLRSYRFENVFFWPHAVERELAAEDGERGLDVVMLGTCYDPDNLRAFWRKKYSQEASEALDDAVEIVLSDRSTSFFRALMQSLAMHEIDPHEVEFDQMAYYVDSYARGIDRIQLIRSIRDACVHVIGGKCWREEKPIEDWNYYLSRQSNVIIHPPVPYGEALEILKHSRICLNSMPFFKDGTHERVFAALSCGSLPLTSDSLYMREIFSEEDLLFYQFTHLDEVNAKILSLLKDEPRRRHMAEQGKRKVKEQHTWDNRVDLMQKSLSSILKELKI